MCPRRECRDRSRHRQIRDADVRAFVEHVRPCRAAIGGLEDPALVVRSISVAERADVNSVRIAGIDNDAADLPRVLKTDFFQVLPASMDLYTPSPELSAERMSDSPVPA